MRLASALSVVGALIAALAFASEGPISVCDSLIRRQALHNRVVAIRGILSATDEGGWLVGDDCGEAVIINGRPWKSAVWLETSGSSRRAVGVWSKDLNDSVRRINAEIAKRGFDQERDRLRVTYIGVFRSYDREDGNAPRGGFGHMNSAPVELIVKDVKDPVIERRPQPAQH